MFSDVDEVKLHSVAFETSAAALELCPPPRHPEFAFIGRSNVGKSSMINLLTGRKDLAKVSATPGKTRLINFFTVNQQWSLVDLPGYGFAKVAKSTASAFNEAANTYIEHRPNLLNTFVLIDSRLKPQALDLAFIGWMTELGLPFSLVFTKIDKLSKSALSGNRERFMEALDAEGIERPESVSTSAAKGLGRGDVLNAIDQVLRASS